MPSHADGPRSMTGPLVDERADNTPLDQRPSRPRIGRATSAWFPSERANSIGDSSSRALGTGADPLVAAAGRGDGDSPTRADVQTDRRIRGAPPYPRALAGHRSRRLSVLASRIREGPGALSSWFPNVASSCGARATPARAKSHSGDPSLRRKFRDGLSVRLRCNAHAVVTDHASCARPCGSVPCSACGRV